MLARLWAPLLQCLSLQLAQLSQSSPLLTAACTLLRAGLLIVPRRAHELLSLVQALISCTASSTVADVQSAPCIMTLLANCMPIISRVVSGTLAPTGSTSQRSSLSGQALPLSTQVVYSADVQVTAHGMAAVTRQLLLQASIQVAAQDSTSHDPDSIVALLHLASVCMAQMPQVLCDSQLLGSLSAATISAMQTFHGDQGRSVLAWTEALCTVGCAPPPAVGLHPSSITAGTTNGSGSRGGRGGRGGGRGNVPAAAVDLQDQAHASFTTRQPIYTQMAIMLHSGNVGPSLMLALLLAASGTMRSELMLPIAMCMHNIWHAVGSDCFWR